MGRTGLFILLAAFSMLLYGCIGGGGTGGTCSTDGDCHEWQVCDTEKGICITGKGYCAADADCNDTLLECDTNSTHTCVYAKDRCRTDANCEAWQTCDYSNNCQPRPGYCSRDSQCEVSWQICSPVTHQCAPRTGFCEDDYDCEAWESCDIPSKKCEPLSGRCNVDTDCEAWEKCYVKGYPGTNIPHYCGPSQPGVTCSSDFHCDTSWQKCDTTNKKCVPRQGYCDADNQCSLWEYCNLKSHKCLVRPDMCGIDSDCGAWQYCSSSHQCRASPGRCTTDSDCASGEVCDETSHTCQ